MIRFKPLDKEEGVALVTVVLMTALVVGLMALALTNGMMGSLVTTTVVVSKQHKECGRGDIQLAEEFLGVLENKEEGVGELEKEAKIIKNGENQIVLTENIEAEIEAVIATEKATTTEMSTLLYDPISDPDITINAGSPEDCVTRTDIRKLYMASPEGGGIDADNAGYHENIKGMACDSGNLFSITAVVENTQTNAMSKFRSIYNDCPD